MSDGADKKSFEQICVRLVWITLIKWELSQSVGRSMPSERQADNLLDLKLLLKKHEQEMPVG